MALLSSIDGVLGKLDDWYFRYHRHATRHEPALFHRGWGSQAAIEAINTHWNAARPPTEIEIEWEHEWTNDQGLWLRRGGFDTPCHREHTPPESHRARLVYARPAPEGRSPVAVLMPTTREADVAGRMPVARALAARGISCVMLESPYMGARTPDHQVGSTLSYLSDFLVLCAVSIEEGCAVQDWLSRQCIDERCTAGFSQGGFLAAAVGLRAGSRSHVVSLLPPHSGAAVLLDGLIGNLCDWDALQSTSGSKVPVRQQMRELFAVTSLERLPQPMPSQRLMLIGALKDRYVPRQSVERLERHWQARAEVRWLSGGHVSSIAERRHFIDAVSECLRPMKPQGELSSSPLHP